MEISSDPHHNMWMKTQSGLHGVAGTASLGELLLLHGDAVFLLQDKLFPESFGDQRSRVLLS